MSAHRKPPGNSRRRTTPVAASEPAAPQLPEGRGLAPDGEPTVSEGDAPMAANTAKRLVLEEPSSGRPDDEIEDHDAFEVAAIAARVAKLDGEPAVKLAGLYHSARLAAVFAQHRLDDKFAEAERYYPAPPPEICRKAPDGSTTYDMPGKDWPTWRRDIFHHWEKQRELIDQALDVVASGDAADEAEALRNELGERTCAAPVRTIEEARAKAGVIAWRLEIEDLTGKESRDLMLSFTKDLDNL